MPEILVNLCQHLLILFGKAFYGFVIWDGYCLKVTGKIIGIVIHGHVGIVSGGIIEW